VTATPEPVPGDVSEIEDAPEPEPYQHGAPFPVAFGANQGPSLPVATGVYTPVRSMDTR
jgi:hypothetical protein